MDNWTEAALLLSQEITFEANVSKNRVCTSGRFTKGQRSNPSPPREVNLGGGMTSSNYCAFSVLLKSVVLNIMMSQSDDS